MSHKILRPFIVKMSEIVKIGFLGIISASEITNNCKVIKYSIHIAYRNILRISMMN